MWTWGRGPGWGSRIRRSPILGLSKDQGMELDIKGRIDLRDWDKIRDFAHRFAESLNN